MSPVVNGTTYREGTPAEVIGILEDVRRRQRHVRIFYGDAATGRDWGEESYTYGRVSRSDGASHIPLLIERAQDLGGYPLQTDCIVRILTSKGEVYRHPQYHQPAYTITVADEMLAAAGYRASVFADGANVANFHKVSGAAAYVAYMTGQSVRRPVEEDPAPMLVQSVICAACSEPMEMSDAGETESGGAYADYSCARCGCSVELRSEPEAKS